jgi:hypothetical protein
MAKKLLGLCSSAHGFHFALATYCWLVCREQSTTLAAAEIEEVAMSKGQDRKKEQRKTPTKTLDEKRAAKKVKKAQRAMRVVI